MWLLPPASGTGVRAQQHTAGSRFSTALLPASSGDPSWGSSMEWVSACAPRQHLFLLQVCPKAVSCFSEGPAGLLHTVCFPGWSSHLRSILLWTRRACKEGGLLSGCCINAQPMASLQTPVMWPPCLASRLQKSLQVGEHGGTVSYVFTVYFLPNFLSLSVCRSIMGWIRNGATSSSGW